MMLIDHLVTFPSGGDGLLMPSPRDWSLSTFHSFPSYPCEDHDDHGGDSNGLVDGDDDGDNVVMMMMDFIIIIFEYGEVFKLMMT